ncbi:Uncharacterised protein [Streptococcus pneumoniae]|nr:Uncharacterised protein [Streptococcus pneumoniae]
MHVQVRDLIAGDHEPRPAGGERRHLRLADLLGDRRQVRDQRRVDLHPFVHLRTGHHERVPRLERRGGQERDARLVLPHEAGGQLAGDDPAEDGGHGGSSWGSAGRGPGARQSRPDAPSGSGPTATALDGSWTHADHEPG